MSAAGRERPALRFASIAAIALGLVTTGGCSREKRSNEGAPKLVVGAGATFPYPLYSKWAAEYARVDPTVRVNYQSVGSGAGVREVSDGVVDFGATDEPMSEDQLRAAGERLVHVPTTIGAVVIAYSLPLGGELALDAGVTADVFMGRVTRWSDPRIRALNPTLTLPDEPIVVVHRADGSGTSAALTTYLAKGSDAWRESVGRGTSPRFPVGVGAKGNEGVAAMLKVTPRALGYVELVYAKQAGLGTAKMKNRAGHFVAPTLEAVSIAAQSADLKAEPLSAALVDAPDDRAYPIAAVSFVVLPVDARDEQKAAPLARFLWWAIHDGQKLAPALDYAPLPEPLVARGERALHELRADGRALLVGQSAPGARGGGG